MPQLISRLQEFGTHVGRLYSLPAVALRVMELTEQPDVDVAEMKRTVETDPALTAKILRVVNSSLFSRVGEVTDLNQALALLGIGPLKLLVLGFSLPTELFENQEASVLEYYWRRALTKAVAARELTRRFWYVSADEAFIAGLLDDLGQLVLLQELAGHYVEFLKRVHVEGADLERREKEALGFHHRQLTADLLRRWNIPESILKGIESPRQTAALRCLSTEAGRLPQVMHLADMVTDALTRPDVASVDALATAARIYRDIAANDISVVLRDVNEMVGQLSHAMGAGIGDDRDYLDIVSEAHGRLAALAEGTVQENLHLKLDDESTEIEREVWDEATALGASLSAMLKFSVKAASQRSSARDSTLKAASPDAMPDEISYGPLETHEQVETRHAARAGALIGGMARRQLLQDVSQAVRICRAQKWPLSLVLFASGGTADSAVAAAPKETHDPISTIVSVCERTGFDHAMVCLLDANRAAWILPDCDRTDAIDLVYEALNAATDRAPDLSCSEPFSAGVASLAAPSKNFDPETLIQSADRCLYGAIASGRGSVKSIAVF
ncbi:MAG: HDOD domain-containing protein [Planctomycetota bacterium]|nr:MAG: HDOD domain-containing protein [Planctomycetota bacterium]REJ93713.1 MAG: HDOD domain-containing protein [Planctomycetota bacterium]